MMNHKRKYFVTIIALLLVFTGCFGNEILDDEVPLSLDTSQVIIAQNYYDEVILPDKFNTGIINTALTVVSKSGLYDGLNFGYSTNATKLSIDFKYTNKSISSVIKVSNKDFSEFPLIINNSSSLVNNTVIIFDNCKFDSIVTERVSDKLKLSFNNCTIRSFYGSNATFTYCYFGGSIADAVNPFQNVTIENSYISNLSHPLPEESGRTVMHSDGTHIFGYDNVDVVNINYDNVRIEVPSLDYTSNHLDGNSVYVNSALSIALEKSNANNLSFTNMYLNGGGYTIYALPYNQDFEVNNVLFDNINIGQSHIWGPEYSKNTIPSDYSYIGNLLIGSVWKDDSKIYVSVTNDTLLERKLIAVTNKGTYEFIVPASPKLDDSAIDKYTFSDLPIDLVYSFDDADWIICYDSSITEANQIRFVNYSDSPVYRTIDAPVDNDIEDSLVSSNLFETDTITPSLNLESKLLMTDLEGKAGSDINFKLSSDGTLTLDGNGFMYNFSSSSNPPWEDYIKDIKYIVVGDGITSIGNQSFRNMTNLQSVDLPDSLESIGANAFMNCSSLIEIHLPINLTSIGAYSFHKSGITTVIHSTLLNWSSLTIGSNNDVLYSANKIIESPNNNSLGDSIEILIDGECGRDLSYVLYSNGELVISGKGSMYNYTSTNTAPWFDYRDIISQLSIDEGVESIGRQAFRNIKNLNNLILPASLKSIGDNSFIGCSALKSVSLSKSIQYIGSYAFWTTAIDQVIYNGNNDEWNTIEIGHHNDSLVESYTNDQ